MADFSSKLPLSMPFVVKKKHKYSLFSASVSCSRLRRVQSILKADGLDGVLCVHGIDSRYNSGTKQLLNYLLFGYCDISAESISVRLTDEALEDLVVLIKHESVHIYCNPINYPLILPLVGHWRNLHFYCLENEEDDEEKTEEFKILSFISMVKGCPKIGIPYGHDHLQKPFDAFIIEKWPLIQSFALEGFGGGGFFTMVHEVVDITSKLKTVYGSLDPVVAEKIITERLPLFERHCKSVLTNIDVERGLLNDLTKLTEDIVSEPVVSYYKHGQISDTSINISSAEDQHMPFVLFGVNTTKTILDEVKTRCTKGCLSSCGISGSPAKHMVCYAADPRGIISCVRTYFFANGFLPHPDVPTNLRTQDQSKDLRLMIDLYLIAVNAVLEGIHSFVQSQDIMKAKSVVGSSLKDGINKKNISVGPKDVKFSLQAQDCLGRKVESQNISPSIYKACLYLYDIPSIEYPGKLLGSVAFGETFFKSAVKSLNKDGTFEWNCKHVILTENVSRYASWVGEKDEKVSSKCLEDFVKSKAENITFGKQLIYGDQCYVGGGTIHSKYEQGTLFVYEKGLIFIHPRCGALSLPLSVIPRMQFYDGESSSTVALMILKYDPSLQSHLPPHLVNTNNMLVIALMPRTKLFRKFYSDVLPLWRNTSDNTIPTLEMITDLPDDLHIMYLGLEEHKTLSEVEMKRTLQHAITSFPDLKSYLAHLHVSSSGDMPVHTDDLAVVLGETKEGLNEEENNNNLELLLTILTGVPRSGKDQLCDTLVKLAKENSKWIILRSPMTHTMPFDAQALQASLGNTLISQRKLLVRMSGRKRIRVVLVTPGFTDIIEVVQAIYSHPNPEVNKNIKIGAVTACIDPENMFMEERYALPKLLDQCAQGWVDNIVFTSCIDPQADKLAMVQKLIRACNPEAAFILAKGGQVTRSSDVELVLSDSAFLKESAVQKRHLMCPGWSLGVFNAGSVGPPVSEICINLFGPLDKHQFVSKLRALQGPIHLKNCLTKGAIHSIRGHVHFIGHNTVTEVHWTALKGSLTMNTVDMTTMPRPPSKAAQNGDVDHYTLAYFVVFTGFSLKEDALRDWLITCGKQIPLKKKTKTLKDLTQKELHQITANHKCDPLPEGWFYTGATYVSLTGEKAFQHPLMDKFVQQYLTSTNEGILKHNSSIDAMPRVDIFKRT